MSSFMHRNNRKKRMEAFIVLARKKHGTQYDYTLSRIDYVNTRSPIRIACTDCGGVFETRPQDHVSSHPYRKGGCPDCLKTSGQLGIGISVRWKKNIADRKMAWLEKANEKNNGRYQYPKLDDEFKNEKSIITAVCSECGHTFQTPARVHISPHRYSGCAVCNKETMAKKISAKNMERQFMKYQAKDQPVEVGYIYQITNTINQKFYIGYTTMDLKRRFKAHVDSSRQIRKQTFKSQSYLHHAMRKYGPEAFTIKPLKTLRHISPIDLAAIESETIIRLKPHYNVTQGGDMWGPVNTTPLAVTCIHQVSGEGQTYRSLAHAARSVGGDPRKIKNACLSKTIYLDYEWSFASNIAP